LKFGLPITFNNQALLKGLIHVVKKEVKEPTEQAPYMVLNKNLIEPLVSWQFISVGKVGSHHVVHLTDEGENALKFLRVRTAFE